MGLEGVFSWPWWPWAVLVGVCCWELPGRSGRWPRTRARGGRWPFSSSLQTGWLCQAGHIRSLARKHRMSKPQTDRARRRGRKESAA